jgi:hypothetical protein
MMLSNLPQRCTLLLWLFSVFISFLIRILFVFSVLFRVFPVPGLVLLPIFYSLLPSSFASALLLLPLSPISPVLSFDLCDSFFMSALYDTSPSSVLLIVLPVFLFPEKDDFIRSFLSVVTSLTLPLYLFPAYFLLTADTEVSFRSAKICFYS